MKPARQKPPAGTPTSPRHHVEYYGDVVHCPEWRWAALDYLRSHRQCQRCMGSSVFVAGDIGRMAALCVQCFEVLIVEQGADGA